MGRRHTPLPLLRYDPPAVLRFIKAFLYALLGLSMVAGACALTFQLATDHNDFPLGYHPDEGGKVEQVRDMRRLNFHHPLLLLETSRLIAERRQLPLNAFIFRASDEQIVACGRLASAIFVTVATGAVALAGWRVGGLAGLACGALAAGLCPMAIVYGHYMKEDAALLCGVGLVVLGVTLVWMERNLLLRWAACAFLGFAVGVAFSGKAAGAATLAGAIPTLLLAWRRGSARPSAPAAPTGGVEPTARDELKLELAAGRTRRGIWSWCWWLIAPVLDRGVRCVLFAACLAATVLVINHRAFDFSGTWPKLTPQAAEGFGGEIHHAEEGHSDSALIQPNTYFVRTTWMLTPGPMRWLIGVCLAGTVVAWVTRAWMWMVREKSRRRAGQRVPVPVYPSILRRTAVGMTLALLLMGFLLSLSYSAIPFRRYAVPAVFLVQVMGGLSVVALARSVRPKRWAAAVAVVGIGALSAAVTPPANDAVDQFAHDSRDQLRAWAATLPKGTVIYADFYASLWSRPGFFVNNRFFVADFGSLADLTRRRVKYVVMCELAYDRFLDPDEYGDALFDTRRARYKEYLSQPIVWQAGGKWPSLSYTSPTIKVIEVRAR
jgi:hypothetical protein